MADPVVVTEYQEILDVKESQEILDVAEATTVISVSEDGEQVVVLESVEQIVVHETMPGEVVTVIEEPVVVQEMAIGTQGPQGESGANWKGVYDSGTAYVTGDIVREGGSLYVCTNPCQGVAVTNTGYWDVFLSVAGAGDLYYHHQQASPSAEWTITHNLGKFPSVMVVDSAGTVVDGAVEYLDGNSLKVYFASAFGGDAYLN
jgi:hypothetical protein